MTQNPIQKDWTPKGTAQTADVECSKYILFICLPPKAHSIFKDICCTLYKRTCRLMWIKLSTKPKCKPGKWIMTTGHLHRWDIRPSVRPWFNNTITPKTSLALQGTLHLHPFWDKGQSTFSRDKKKQENISRKD